MNSPIVKFDFSVGSTTLTVIILFTLWGVTSAKKWDTREVCDINGDCKSLEDDKVLDKALGQIESDHLRFQLTPNQKKRRGRNPQG